MPIELAPLKKDDLHFLTTVRNECRHFLHCDKLFTVSDVERWYKIEQPKYLVIWYYYGLPKKAASKHRVGYVRLSPFIATLPCIYVGCDIHKNFQRQGIATRTHDILVNALIKNGPFKTFLCEILSHNVPSLCFALNYGFRIIHIQNQYCERDGRWLDNLTLSLKFENNHESL